MNKSADLYAKRLNIRKDQDLVHSPFLETHAIARAHAQTNLGEQKNAGADRFYLPHTVSVKHILSFFSVGHYSCIFFLAITLFIHLLFTHFFLVLDSK